jgi:hypothetical protein
MMFLRDGLVADGLVETRWRSGASRVTVVGMKVQSYQATARAICSLVAAA